MRILELLSYRDRATKRDLKLLSVLSFIHTNVWRCLFGKQVRRRGECGVIKACQELWWVIRVARVEEEFFVSLFLFSPPHLVVLVIVIIIATIMMMMMMMMTGSCSAFDSLVDYAPLSLSSLLVLSPALSLASQADNLEKIDDTENEYAIIDKDLIVNHYISVPPDMGGLNCGAYVAGIVRGVLQGSGFPAEVTAYSRDVPGSNPKAMIVMRFTREVILREQT